MTGCGRVPGTWISLACAQKRHHDCHDTACACTAHQDDPSDPNHVTMNP
jgi:hypothetical protein